MNILKTILNKKNLYQNKNPTKNCGMEKTMLYKFKAPTYNLTPTLLKLFLIKNIIKSIFNRESFFKIII